MKPRKLFYLIGFVCFLCLTTSCQDSTDEIVKDKPDDVKTITITMLAKSSSNPVFLSARAGAEATARDLSDKNKKIDIKIDWRTPEIENAEEQAERILSAVNDGSDAIIVSCSDDSILTGAINKAVDEGVPVMTFDSDAPNSKRFAYYGPNDVEIGERVMTELAALIDEVGKVAVLGGNQKAPNLKKRVQGIRDAAGNYPQIEIVGEFYHAENATDAVATMMKVHEAHPDLVGWAMVGGWPFFSDSLLNQLEPGQLKIVAVDALPVQLPYIEQGIVNVFLGQPTFRLGEISVRTVIDKIYFQKDVEEINEMQLIRVWKDNLGGWSRQLRAWGYDGIPRKYLTM
ncbi:substrate-binding domain-containing protein [candidate division KSB1 bacterium]|nr:substrate-binding domain-containing protein [candidate division KSB1 bacterium]